MSNQAFAQCTPGDVGCRGGHGGFLLGAGGAGGRLAGHEAHAGQTLAGRRGTLHIWGRHWPMN